MWIVVGLGPNSVEVPCLVFTNREKALSYIEPHLGPGKGDSWEVDFDHGNEWAPFFTSYYGGCGECWCLELREISEGVPFVGFNLD